MHHAHSNASYHYIDNSAFLIDTPHYNILLYDKAIDECVEVVLDNNHHQNSMCSIIYFIILYYKFEVVRANTQCTHNNTSNNTNNTNTNTNRTNRTLPNNLKDLICKVFMIEYISEFDQLLKQINILT